MITTAARICAAERAIAYHVAEINTDVDRPCCNEADAQELLASLSLWALTNGYTLRIPRPEYAEVCDD